MIHSKYKFFLRSALCLALISGAFSSSALAQDSKPAAAPGTPIASPQATPAPTSNNAKAKYLRYMRVGASGTDARNLGDANGVSVGKLSSGTLVAVYEEQGDWLQCEVPGGFEIWVYGQYVKPSSEANVLEITGADVRARPLASSGTESFPLQPNLSRGDRVRLITRNDAAKPLAEDWIKVYSPPGVRGFVAKADCEALAAGADGAAVWSAAVIEARKRTSTLTIKAPEKTIPTSVVLGSAVVGDLTPQQAMEELKRADAALAIQRAAAKPEFAGVRAQYERIVASVTEGATHDLAQRGLEQTNALSDAYALKLSLEEERRRAVEASLTRQAALDKAANNRDIYSGRYATRGWVEKRTVAGQPPTYLLRWGDGLVSEITCNSGRYDLSAFNGYDIGVKGKEQRAFIPGDIGRVAVPRLVDAGTIEVISGRQGKH